MRHEQTVKIKLQMIGDSLVQVKISFLSVCRCRNPTQRLGDAEHLQYEDADTLQLGIATKRASIGTRYLLREEVQLRAAQTPKPSHN